MKKARVLILAAIITLLAPTAAIAADITPKVYDKQAPHNDFSYYSNGIDRGYDYPGYTTSTHLYGTWNNPYTAGVDAYNYNDAQGYTQLGQGGIVFVWGESILPLLQQMGYTTEQAKMYFPFSLQAGIMWSYIDPSKATMEFVGQGPHGGYATTTHKCRECHAVHRAAGKFKLLRADSRVEACDWCHGLGAGSGYNIQMDNDDNFTQEYNVGHTMGFGTSDGKFKAPDDTYPAYTPKYYMGGFSCIDCHSPHGNPSRLLGFMDQGRMMNPQASFPLPKGDDGNSIFYKTGIQVSGFISNPGETSENTEMMRVPWPLNIRRPDYEITVPNFGGTGLDAQVFNVWQAVADGVSWLARRPIVPGGRYLLVENPDVEIINGQEIKDYNVSKVTFPGDGNAYRVNKTATSWDFPYGTVSEDDLLGDSFGDFINPLCAAVTISQFCQDCHDGNAGLHTDPSPLFSEDRASRGLTGVNAYDIGYGHDTNPRHCGRQMKFNPEDADANTGYGNFGPHCRNCHRGASSCERCHENGLIGTTDASLAAHNVEEDYPEFAEATFDVNVYNNYPYGWPLYGGLSSVGIPAGFPVSWLEAFGYEGGHYNKTTYVRNANERWYHERTVAWASDWRTNATALSPVCSDDGFSWPHRTMGFMMLKDELFGLDFDGTPVEVGQVRDGIPKTILSDGTVTDVATNTLPSALYGKAAHDLDSVCLDCHNPTIWNATSYDNHFDSWARDDDNYNDELLLRGLP